MSTAPDLDMLIDLVKRQSVTSAELANCTTFAEIALVIAQNMLRTSGQFVTVTLADYSDAGEFIRQRVVASANRKQSFEAQNAFEMTREDLGLSLAAILDEARPALIEDVENNTVTSSKFK